MRSAYRNQSESDRPAPLSRRATGIILAIAIEALIIILLIFSGQRIFVAAPQQTGLKTFTVGLKPETTPSVQTEQKKKRTVTKPKTRPPPATKPPVPPTPLGPIPGLITLSRKDYAKSDIGKIESKSTEVAEQGDSAQGDSHDSVAMGSAPNGEPLYNAEWYREPTDAELAFYIPKGLRAGAALIACKTAPRYRVEDCVVLGDAPPGTGLARGIREAAWQFRVRPPRKGGKDLIGAWVQIRFDLIQRER